MNSYVIIMTYRGDMYVYKQTAPNKGEAARQWAKSLNTSDIMYMADKGKADLISKIEAELTEIDNERNVWRICAGLKTGSALIHIVKNYKL